MSQSVEKSFQSTKTYCHNVGLSACFRQWRANSHCKFLHGYALEVKLVFEGPLDERNWVQDFGGLKEIKAWLEDMFDHKTLVAQDDPLVDHFRQLESVGLIELTVVPATGCERFAELIFDHVSSKLPSLKSVEVREHAGNSAVCYRK